MNSKRRKNMAPVSFADLPVAKRPVLGRARKSGPPTKRGRPSGRSRKQAVAGDEKTEAVVTVGDGRGFIVAGQTNRVIITAAHCLPSFPPCTSVAYTEERTYKNLVGRLGGTKTVWVECF